MNFADVAPYLSHPLVLLGFVMLLFFGVHRTLLRSGVIPPLSARSGSRIVQTLLRYGFVIAVLVIVLGFTLEAVKLSTPVSANLITLEKYEARLKRREAEIRAELEKLSAAETEKRKRLEKELAETRARLDNIETAYEDLKRRLAMQAQAMTDIERDAAPEQLAQARKALAAGDRSEAEARFREVLALFKGRAAQVANQLSLLAETEADWSSAKQLSQQASQLEPAPSLSSNGRRSSTATSSPLLKDDSASRWAEGYGLLLNLEVGKAEERFQLALEIDELRGDRSGIAHDYMGVGHAELVGALQREPDPTQANLKPAEAYYRRALATSKEIAYAPGIVNATIGLALLYKHKGDKTESERLYREALSIAEEAGYTKGAKSASDALAWLSVERGDIQAYFDLISDKSNASAQNQGEEGSVDRSTTDARAEYVLFTLDQLRFRDWISSAE